MKKNSKLFFSLISNMLISIWGKSGAKHYTKTSFLKNLEKLNITQFETKTKLYIIE